MYIYFFKTAPNNDGFGQYDWIIIIIIIFKFSTTNKKQEEKQIFLASDQTHK